MLEMYQDGVRVYVLPDGAKCLVDKEERSPLDLSECPMGYEFCTGNCEYYTEE